MSRLLLALRLEGPPLLVLECSRCAGHWQLSVACDPRMRVLVAKCRRCGTRWRFEFEPDGEHAVAVVGSERVRVEFEGAPWL